VRGKYAAAALAAATDLARRNASDAGVENVEFIKGYLEDLPLPDASVDVVISNCVINLSGDKPTVLAEAARVLKPGGRFAVSDVIADPDVDEATKADMAAWTGCIAGALTEPEFRDALSSAGLVDRSARPTASTSTPAQRSSAPASSAEANRPQRSAQHQQPDRGDSRDGGLDRR
jgi:SAM-dependent methyltransferase